MKPLDQWTEADLRLLVSDGATEGLQLDFKGSRSFDKLDSLKALVSKHVSGFANAAGGRLIFGVTEKDGIADRVDDGVHPDVMSRERLADLIQGQIQPPIEGLQTFAIDLTNGNRAFVVEVPAATALAPHQANDRRYYRRYDKRTEPMYDHEVRDLMRRAHVPAPIMRCDYVRMSARPQGALVLIDVFAENLSPQPLEYGRFELLVDDRVGDINVFNFQQAGRESLETSGGLIPVRVFRKEWTQNDTPLYRELPTKLDRIELEVGVRSLTALGWRVVCPGSNRHQLDHWYCEAGVFRRHG